MDNVHPMTAFPQDLHPSNLGGTSVGRTYRWTCRAFTLVTSSYWCDHWTTTSVVSYIQN